VLECSQQTSDQKKTVSIQSWVQFFTQRRRMKKEKRSIILFYDVLHMINALNDKQAGLVIKSLIDYEIEGYDYMFENSSLQYIFEVGKKQLDRGRELFIERYGDSDEQ
jgi:hypothetical protein